MIHTRLTTKTLALAILLSLVAPATSFALPATSANDQFATIQDNQNNQEDYVPQGFSNKGLYGCAGGGFGSVGSAHAGGAFVPVSEEAVALNSHMLLYKECILDGIVARVREAMVAAMVKSTFEWVNKNQDGEAAFVTNLEEYKSSIVSAVVKDFTEGERTEGIFDVFKQDVREGLAHTYAQASRKPENAYKHTIPDDKKTEFTQFVNGSGPFTWEMYLLAIQPQNNPLGAYALTLNQLVTDIDHKVDDKNTELGWSGGYKSVEKVTKVPTGNGTYEERSEVVTPGSAIKNIIDYVSLTGHRQTENADEIDELMGSLMSNIHTQILTSVGGLRGLTQSSGGAASYVNRIASDASARARAEYSDVGTGFLGAAIAVETSYGAARKASKDLLEDAAKYLSNKEDACWDGLIAQAKEDIIAEVVALACAAIPHNALGGTNVAGSCTLTGSATVVNSIDVDPNNDLDDNTPQPTEYDVVITAKSGTKTVTYTLRRHTNNSFKKIAQNISPLLRVVNQSIEDSDKALAILSSLQASLLANDSPSNTRFVLEQVDQLVEAGSLHKDGDVYTAQAQHEKIASTMKQLTDETNEEWAEGWCDPTNWRDQIK